MCEEILLSNKSEPTILRFCSHQDALDFASHSVEYGNRRLAINDLNKRC